MGQVYVWQRLAAASGSALVGGTIGVLMAAFAYSVSSSMTGVGAGVLAGTLVGGCAGRFAGALVGALCGGLLAALGSVLGGSTLGVVVTLVACTLLGGWLRWVHESKEQEAVSSGADFRLPSVRTAQVTCPSPFGKELVSWS
jgi:hypothetical protein